MDLLGIASRGISLCFDSAWRCRDGSFVFHLSEGPLSLDRRSGLLVRDTSFSLVVMVVRSVLLSSVLLLAGRGLPEADLLWAVLVKEPPGCGEGPLRDSRCSALKLC